MEPVPREAEIVVNIFEWCALDGLTTHRIAKRLTEMAVPTLTDTDGVRKRKSGVKGQWHRDTVHGMLTNTTYKGEWRYRKNKVIREDTPDGVKTHVERRNEDESIPVPVPAIVSSDLWQAAQDKLKKNAKKGFKPTKYKYLLRGRLKCGKCGGGMAGNTRVSKSKKGTAINWHYRCIRKYQFGVKSPSACDCRNVNGPLVENEVWNRVVGLLLDEERLFNEIEIRRDEMQRSKQIIEQTIKTIEGQIEMEQIRLDRLLDLYLDGDVDKRAYAKKRRNLESKVEQRQIEVRDLCKHLEETKPITSAREAELMQLRTALLVRLEDASFKQMKQLLNTLQVECVYDDDSGEVLMTGVFGTQRFVPEELQNDGSILSDTSVGCRYIRTFSFVS